MPLTIQTDTLPTTSTGNSRLPRVSLQRSVTQPHLTTDDVTACSVFEKHSARTERRIGSESSNHDEYGNTVAIKTSNANVLTKAKLCANRRCERGRVRIVKGTSYLSTVGASRLKRHERAQDEQTIASDATEAVTHVTSLL